MKVFNPTNGLRKYAQLEIECKMCGKNRVIYPHELEIALKSTTDLLIRFRCGGCKDKGFRAINRQWFEWNNYKYDLFTPW